MRRRLLLTTALAIPAAMAMPAWAADAPAAATPFDANTVRTRAKELSAKPYSAPDRKLPDAFNTMDYDHFRSIRFDPAHALWRGQNLPFEAQFFHRGFLFKDRVDINEVADGTATRIVYSPDLFDFGPNPKPPAGDIGFAGFRIHSTNPKATGTDEVCAFLGASYFRAIARGMGYGISARGLAINTGMDRDEEFPVFREFWLERPQPNTTVFVLHALLDSPSASGAYKFTVRPGDDTTMDIESYVYPRVDIDQAGLAPLTSMFDFGPAAHTGFDDWRPAVHDSDGLQLWTGRGEQIWRPLVNPHNLQVSVFSDASPRGFGLMQRARKFEDYQDLETDYEKRPSLWVEPIGDPGEGAVMLIEIPTKSEVDDNMVAFWRPKAPLKAKSEYTFTYRLHWCVAASMLPEIARVIATRSGVSFGGKTREFVLDIGGGKLTADSKPRLEVSSDHGKVLSPVTTYNTEVPNTWRASFELDTQGSQVVELRARLVDDQGPLSETWLYRWTPA